MRDIACVAGPAATVAWQRTIARSGRRMIACSGRRTIACSGARI
jgi:hypothetical protein